MTTWDNDPVVVAIEALLDTHGSRDEGVRQLRQIAINPEAPYHFTHAAWARRRLEEELREPPRRTEPLADFIERLGAEPTRHLGTDEVGRLTALLDAAVNGRTVEGYSRAAIVNMLHVIDRRHCLVLDREFQRVFLEAWRRYVTPSHGPPR